MGPASADQSCKLQLGSWIRPWLPSQRPFALPRPACRAIAQRNTRLHYVDCHIPPLLTSVGYMNRTMWRDGVHPSALGYDAMFST